MSPTRGYHPAYCDPVPPYTYTSPVGSFAANAYGLHDLAGNVWEWSWDRFDNYNSSPGFDPRGPALGDSFRIFRGVGWGGDGVIDCRVARRGYNSPAIRNAVIGFRTVIAPSQ